MSSCQRCSQTHNRADAFLVACRACRKSWHHRCLMPPMEDDVLIGLIRATNRGDTANDLSNWVCRRCKKRASETPSAMSSREQTASSESREDSKRLTSSHSSDCSAVRDATPATSVTSTADIGVKQESSTTVDARPTDDRGRSRSGRQKSTEAAPVKCTMIASKRTKLSGTDQPRVPPQPGPAQPRDSDAQMTDAPPAKLLLPEKKNPPQRPSPLARSHVVKAARKLGDIVSTTSSEDDVEMQVNTLTSSGATLRASQGPSSIRPESVAKAPLRTSMRAGSATNEQGRETKPAGGMAIPPSFSQAAANEIDDDPEDLYGPPVERRIIRILPSLAEELREQQWRVAAEKEKRRVPLAPDWILARHVNDPLWKEIPATEERQRRKPAARKLGDNGLNVDELMGYFTVENWVREHKA